MKRKASSLAVLVRCRWLLCALPVRAVSRLVLGDELEVEGAAGAGPMVVREGDRRWAGWDLGDMLGVGSGHDAWVLMDIEQQDGTLPLALRTGPCLRVQELVLDLEVPRSIFCARRSAFTSVFAADALHGAGVGDTGLVGVALEPSRLWSARELSASRSLLSPERPRAVP